MTDNMQPPSGDDQPGFAAGQPTPPPVEPPASPYGTPTPGGYPPPPPPPPSAPQAGTYYSNQQGYAVSGPKNDPFAITSLATSIPSLGLILICCCWPINSILSVIVGIVGIAFGAISLSRIQKSNGMLSGKGMALAGLIIGIVAIVLNVGLVVLILLGNISAYSS